MFPTHTNLPTSSTPITHTIGSLLSDIVCLCIKNTKPLRVLYFLPPMFDHKKINKAKKKKF